jgi:hypothetical protein
MIGSLFQTTDPRQRPHIPSSDGHLPSMCQFTCSRSLSDSHSKRHFMLPHISSLSFHSLCIASQSLCVDIVNSFLKMNLRAHERNAVKNLINVSFSLKSLRPLGKLYLTTRAKLSIQSRVFSAFSNIRSEITLEFFSNNPRFLKSWNRLWVRTN